MMGIRWTRRALSRLDQIGTYISAENPEAARRVLVRISARVHLLSEQPFLGREGRVKGTRELVMPEYPYIVAYRVVPDGVEILTVIHAARRWPDSL